tara:strand:+ start:1520 stop:3307 length:1788 start_codon:yes stop_codon:yes gene_type:complete
MSQIKVNLNGEETEVIIDWSNLEDQAAFSLFLSTEFSDVQIFRNQISIPLGKFISSRRNFSSFLSTNPTLRQETFISEDVKKAIRNIPKYKDEIGQQVVKDEGSITNELKVKGFKRELKWFQLRNLVKVSNLSSIANFSVPGSGKTTEALAFFSLKKTSDNDRLLIISPINAFTAWEEDVPECIEGKEVVRLRGDITDINKLLNKEDKFFITNYEYLRTNLEFLKVIAEELLNKDRNYFVVLDESHKMKGEETSKILSYISPLVKNKIILTGTPMPQGPKDLLPQFSFLYPEERLISEETIVSKFQPIYVRTTKNDMNKKSTTLPPLVEKIKEIEMSDGHREVYDIIKNRLKEEKFNFKKLEDIKAFKRAVMRMLQICSNPLLQIDYISKLDQKLADKLLDEGIGSKMNQLISDVNLLAQNQKIIVWSSFPKNLRFLQTNLSHLNAVSVYGGIPSGDAEDIETREYAINQFKNNEYCRVFLANPMAAGEGISLHKACHKALYLDRTYNLAHYLQSKDRIHRIGSDINRDVEIDIYQLKSSVDVDVHHRLELKLANMSRFLNDPSILSNFQSLDVEESNDWENDDLRSAYEFITNA